MSYHSVMIEINITPEMIIKAKVHSKEVEAIKKSSYDSIRKGEGTIVGSLGELIVANNFSSLKWCNTYDYDFISDGITIDVKTKDRTVPPKINYEASISGFNTKQKCDMYIFVSLLREGNTYTKGFIMGMIDKDTYFSTSRFIREGEIDPSNNWKALCDCYNLPYNRLMIL